MANTFSPSGFQPVRRLDGAAWNVNQTQYQIAAANGHSFFSGDPVFRLNTGYIDRDVRGNLPTQGVLGIFVGCEYLSLTTGTIIFSNTYPTGAANGDVTAYVIDDPSVVMSVWVGTGTGSAAGGPAVFADIGNSISYSLGTGSTTSGLSGAYVDYATASASTATLPFTIYGVITTPPGVNGTDLTTAGNQILVTFNQQAFRVGTTPL